MKDTTCPYCNCDLDINHDDGYGYAECQIWKQDCPSCNKTFTFTTSISFSYYTEKADCLNDGKHDFVAMVTYPKQYTKMECSMCGERRSPTDEEMQEILNEYK